MWRDEFPVPPAGSAGRPPGGTGTPPGGRGTPSGGRGTAGRGPMARRRNRVDGFLRQLCGDVAELTVGESPVGPRVWPEAAPGG
ncbi:hypothetical protein CW362_32880 [Streptomyces populi]|uniref:Uncharacterized protein n=1 Tax=Streptomyces populi TaxID=2058924 RepID=A0A2I0SFW7_9ACTN|nr:hypothetical protein CW362_32880 [Streptomyces populi]